MRQAFRAERPSPREGRQIKHAGPVCRAQRRLPRERKAGSDNVLDVGRGKAQLALGFAELIGEFEQLLAELALKLEHGPDRFAVAFGARRVEHAPTPEHGFLDLLGNHRADLAEVFTDGFDLERGAHQEFEVAFQIDLPRAGGNVHSG